MQHVIEEQSAVRYFENSAVWRSLSSDMTVPEALRTLEAFLFETGKREMASVQRFGREQENPGRENSDRVTNSAFRIGRGKGVSLGSDRSVRRTQPGDE